MRGVMLVVEFTATSNDVAVDLARRLDAFLGTEPNPGGLLSYRIVRHTEHTTRVSIVEEWTDIAMQHAFVARPAFSTFMHEIAPLLAAPPNGDVFDVVGAGPIAPSPLP